MHRRHHLRLKKDIITLYPGEFFVSKEDIYIYTVLGSCISVCIYDQHNTVGGMNHFMLSGIGSAGEAKNKNFLSNNTRYGMAAMEVLINGVLKKGGKRENLKAKVFGGANMIQLNKNSAKVSEDNITFAKWYLDAEEIQIVSIDVGGDEARKVFFDPNNGKVFVKHIIPSDSELQKELEYEKKAINKPIIDNSGKDIELF